MPSILITPPAVEPISLAEAKLYLRVEHADDDALITALIVAARRAVETRTRRALIDQTWRCVRDAWPAEGRLLLPLAPARTVLAARVFDHAGLAHDVDPQLFVISPGAAPAELGFAPGALAPPGRSFAGIELDVRFGYGAAAADVPEPLRQAVRLFVAHAYEHRGLEAIGARLGTSAAGFGALIAPYRVLSL